MRLPTPARRDWSISRAFSGAVPVPKAARKPAGVSPTASGPSRDSSASSSTRPRRRGSRMRRSPPSSKRTAKRSHRSSAAA